MVYTITRERLAALSPAARQLAQIALEEGIWVLVDEKTGGGAQSPSRRDS